MKTILFGGSFNPPHNGHVAMVQHMRAQGYQQIIVVPSHTPLAKHVPKNSPSPHERLKLVQLAFAGLSENTAFAEPPITSVATRATATGTAMATATTPDGFATTTSIADNATPASHVIIDPYEIEAGTKQYAIEVVEHIYNTYTITDKLHMFIGDDHIDSIHHWHRWQELAQRVVLVVAPRYMQPTQGKQLAQVEQSPQAEQPPWEHGDHANCDIINLKTPIIAVSSSEIREALGLRKSIKHLVPKKVANRIEKNLLY